MKENKTEYKIVNVFSETNEAHKKQKINIAIRNLCMLDIEKEYGLDYNTYVAFCGSVPDLQKGGHCKC